MTMVTQFKNKNNTTKTQQRSSSVHQPLIFNSKPISKVLLNETDKQLKYYLGKGNNQSIIRRVLSCRMSWVELDDSTSTFVNLKWQQDQKGFKYNRLIDSQMYRCTLNQFQFHQCLCNKEYLFKNLSTYAMKNNIDVYSIVPPTFVLNAKDENNMQSLKLFLDFYQKHCPKKVCEINKLNKAILKTSRNLKSHFFNCNKNNVVKKPPLENSFLDEVNGEYLWIIKPTFLNRGRGIQVFSKLQTLQKYIQNNVIGYIQKSLDKSNCIMNKITVDYVLKNLKTKQESVKIKPKERKETVQSSFNGNQYIRMIPKGPAIIRTDCFLIQKYLEKPFLIQNRKFDVRVWVLITHHLRCYVFREGYIRLSSMEYSCTDSQNNSFMHLTNNSVQKYSKQYGQIADGNQLSFKQLSTQMENKNLSYSDCLQKIYSHIKISLKSICSKLNPQKRKFTFQIFGYDFMIDENGYPWLIQVNNNPCLDESSKILKQLIPRLINDTFKLTIDQLFYNSFPTIHFPVSGYSHSLNLWFDLKLDLNQTKL